jgi:hypothetical protein
LQEETSFKADYISDGMGLDGWPRRVTLGRYVYCCLNKQLLVIHSFFQQKSTSSAFLPIERNNIVVAAAPGERSAVAPGERSAIAPAARSSTAATTAPRTTPVFSLQNSRKSS